MGYHSAIRRQEVWVRAPTWLNFKNIVLSERSPMQKSHIWCDFVYMESLEQVNPWKQTSDSHTGIGRLGKGLGSNCFRDKGFEFEVMEMFWNQTEVAVVQHCGLQNATKFM